MRLALAGPSSGWAQLSDDAVIAEVRGGHTALFEVLMRRYNERVYRAARAIVKDEAEAEEVMQQAYVNAYSHLSQFDGRARFSTWLTRIAVNEALAHLHRRQRFVVFDAEHRSSREYPVPDSSALNPERQAFGHELGTLIESAIDRLPAGTREVFVLRQVEGMSTAEVAEALDVSTDVVKTRFSRARASLRRELETRAGDAARESFRFLKPRCDRVVEAVLRRIARA